MFMRQAMRRAMSTAAAMPKPGLLQRAINATFFTRAGQATLVTTGGSLLLSFQVMADSHDIFEYTFTTTKDPDAIVDFYSTEDFLQILGIFPIAIHAILAGVEWDPKAEQTNTVWNMMRISFDITEKEEQIDGKDTVTYFNKRERFVQMIPWTNILLWDQVQNYGYRRLPDGTLEVSHQGESFYGPWPVRLLVGLHARYVIWATEKHINSKLFGTEDLELQEHQRSNIPAHVAREWLASLSSQQEDAIQKARLQGRATQNQETTLKTLKRLQRRDTLISVEHTPGVSGVLTGNMRVKMEDDEAQKAVTSALKNIKAAEGSDKAAETMASLLDQAPAQKPSRRDAIKYGHESTGKKYGGIFKPSARNLQRQHSTLPDDMALMRLDARSLRILEMFDEATDAVDKRPEVHSPRMGGNLKGLDWEQVVEKASHRHCVTMWDAYSRCKDGRKGKVADIHDQCKGWWKEYTHCMDTTSPKLTLNMLEALAREDPDPNMERIKR